MWLNRIRPIPGVWPSGNVLITKAAVKQSEEMVMGAISQSVCSKSSLRR